MPLPPGFVIPSVAVTTVAYLLELPVCLCPIYSHYVETPVVISIHVYCIIPNPVIQYML